MAVPRRTDRWIFVGAMLCALAAPILAVAAALGSKFGLWDWKFGMGVMTKLWLPPVAWIGMIAAVIGGVVMFVRHRRRTMMAFFLVAIFPAATLYGLRQQQSLILELPAIHDVQTDWYRPIIFSDDALEDRARAGATNPILIDPVIIDDGRRARWANMRFAEAQAMGYPQIQPLMMGAHHDPNTILSAAQRALTESGIHIVRINRADDQIVLEGYQSTFWYGLTDDVALRIMRNEDQSWRVDMRSIGREGHIDLGENAKRIQRVFNRLEQQLRRV